MVEKFYSIFYYQPIYIAKVKVQKPVQSGVKFVIFIGSLKSV